MALVACLLWLAACGTSSPAGPGRAAPGAGRVGPPRAAHPAGTPGLAHWSGLRHVRGVVDLSSPRPDGAIVIAARGRLDTLTPGSGVRPFAPRYSAPPGLEPYIVVPVGRRIPAAECAFGPASVYALRLAGGHGITVVTGQGEVRKFAALPGRGLEDGIAFDSTGRFGHRLLVTLTSTGKTTVFAVDCRGRVQVLTRDAPRVEGGIAVAPASFGRFGGDLIAPDELSGTLYAIAPDGRTSVIASSGLPHGQDVGVESEGFVPASFTDALVADRRTLRNRHPGDDLILSLSRAALVGAGVRAGDMLAVSEGGAQTIDVSCRASACGVRHIADGPPIAHIEGHVVFGGRF